VKILVTGGAGFVGSNLIEALKDNHEVISLDNYEIGSKENHVKGVTYLEADIVDIQNILINDFDLCFHLAGLSRIQPSFENPYNTFKSNTIGVQTVLDWARTNGTKVVYSGSSSRHHNPYQSPYALYKYLGEEICKMYRVTFNMDIEIVRFYNVYGPNEIIDGDWAAVIGVWRRQVRDGEKITIVGDGQQKRDFTHIGDIVKGLILVSMSDQKNHDAWEMGSGINYSIKEVYRMFHEKFNIECNYVNNQSGNYKSTLRENNDMIDILGWKPKDKLKQYIDSL
tara:strand:+ start:1630 stop:2475 length:846 start_codon:yes stop_codon:yes gene_type:complete